MGAVQRVGVGKRIAIVGGGPAGLSAALALWDAGHRSFTVFEKGAEVGGKCLTVEHDPGVTYELGASSMSQRYTHVFRLIDRFGLTRERVESSRYFGVNVRDPGQTPWLQVVWEHPIDVARLLLSGQWIIHRRSDTLEPGFAGVDPRYLREVLSRPLLERIHALGLGILERTARTLVSGIGYGYVEETPAAYLWKYLSLWRPSFPALGPDTYELFQVGMQGLFKAIATHLGKGHVRTGCEVTRIDRESGPAPVMIQIKTGEKEELAAFDCVILACPLDDAAKILDKQDEEQALLTRLSSYTFHTILAELDSYPTVRWGFHLDNHAADKKGRVVLSARRHLDLNQVVFYVLDRSADAVKDLPGPRQLDLTKAEVNAAISGERDDPQSRYIAAVWRDLRAELTTKMNLRRVEPVRHIVWKYFPHYSCAEVAKGSPLRLEALQGTRNTYYAGEIMDFSVVERVVQYSQHLVRTYFES